jgi:hypothetical protein
LKPCSTTFSWYGPTGRFGSVKVPSAPVKTVRTMPVSVLVTVTSAPGTVAALESRTTPES